MATLPNSLLLTYQMEYENDQDITLEELCEKYDLQKKQLKGYTRWKKAIIEIEPAPPEEPKVPTAEDIVLEPEIVIPEKSMGTLQVGRMLAPLEIPKDREELLKDIEDFKGLAVAHAVKFMKNDAEFAEIKEFKDMVAIVDSIERSYRDVKDPTGTTINIAIQNLVSRFTDDC
jgi:hypothetical protein